MTERTRVDRRPGIEVPAKKPKTSRFAYLAKSRAHENSLLASSSVLVAALVALALLYGCDAYFFDGFYGNTALNLVKTIGAAFG